jgi:hypothetical protein
MGLFWKSPRTAALEEAINRLRDERDDLAKSLRLEKVTCDALDRTAKKYRQERDAARAELKVFTDRRERAKMNLKQFRNGHQATGQARA